jgi:hypothetical protein
MHVRPTVPLARSCQLCMHRSCSRVAWTIHRPCDVCHAYIYCDMCAGHVEEGSWRCMARMTYGMYCLLPISDTCQLSVKLPFWCAVQVEELQAAVAALRAQAAQLAELAERSGLAAEVRALTRVDPR